MHAPKNPHLRAAIEVGFIVFLFYANLLMGEYTLSAGHGKTLLQAVNNIFTIKTVCIALVTATAGHFAFELFRDKAN